MPNAVLAVLAWRGDRRTGPVAVATGLVLVLWILVELAFLRERQLLPPALPGDRLLMVWLGGGLAVSSRVPGQLRHCALQSSA